MRTAVKFRAFSVAVLILFFTGVNGCHTLPKRELSSEEEGFYPYLPRVRSKRQVDSSVEDFFAECLSGRMQTNLYLPTVVDYMIRQTYWFENTDQLYCRDDQVTCWNDYTNYFLKWNSPFLAPVKECLNEFAGQVFYVQPSVRLAQPPFGPSSPLNIFDFKNIWRRFLPAVNFDDQSVADLHSLIDFFRTEFVCVNAFCDCTGLILATGERCGDTWLSRLVGATRRGSPLRQSLVNAANIAIINAQRTVTPAPATTTTERPRRRNLFLFYWLLSLLSGSNSVIPVNPTIPTVAPSGPTPPVTVPSPTVPTPTIGIPGTTTVGTTTVGTTTVGTTTVGTTTVGTTTVGTTTVGTTTEPTPCLGPPTC